MSIIDIIDDFLKNNKNIEIVKSNKSVRLPLEVSEFDPTKKFDSSETFIEKITYYISPVKKLYNVSLLQKLTSNIVPISVKPTAIYNVRENDPDEGKHWFDIESKRKRDPLYAPKPSHIILGKVHFVEDVGSIVETVVRTITDDKLLEKYHNKIEQAVEKKLQRRVSILIFPENNLVKELHSENSLVKGIESKTDKYLSIDYTIKISEFEELSKKII